MSPADDSHEEVGALIRATAARVEAPASLRAHVESLQADRVRQLVTEAGQPFDYVDLPTMAHSLHGTDPQLYVDTLRNWASTLPTAVTG